MTELMLAIEATKDLTERDSLELIDELIERHSLLFNQDPIKGSHHFEWVETHVDEVLTFLDIEDACACGDC